MTGERRGQRAPVAFFDVDNILMRGCTIASYVHFVKKWLQDERVGAQLLELECRGPADSDRETLIADYLRLLTGQSWSHLVRWGQQWYEQVGRDLLVPAVLAQLNGHRHREDSVVFVSGSWLPCLLPIAVELGVEYVYCCQVEVEGGVLTGTVRSVMLGSAKAEAVQEFARRHQVDLSDCFAYGDDIGDADMLSQVGHPVAVRPSPALKETAPAMT